MLVYEENSISDLKNLTKIRSEINDFYYQEYKNSQYLYNGINEVVKSGDMAIDDADSDGNHSDNDFKIAEVEMAEEEDVEIGDEEIKNMKALIEFKIKNKYSKASTIVPSINKNMLIINKKEFIFSEGFLQFNNQEVKITKGLINLITLNMPNKITDGDLENYAKMLNYAGSKKHSKYFKRLNELSNERFKKKIFIGTGFSPIELFIELSKLLAAKQAGHNNVKDSVEEIIDELNNSNELN